MPTPKDWIRGPAAAAAYFAAAWLAYRIRATSGLPPLIWYANGVALSALLHGGWRMLPWLAAASLGFNLYRGLPLLSYATSDAAPFPLAPLLTLGNLLGPAAGAWLLRSHGRPESFFDDVRGTLGFLLRGALLGGLFGASLENAVIAVGHGVPAGPLSAGWLEWWFDEVAGVIVLVPAVALALDAYARRAWTTWRWRWEALPLFLAVLTVSLYSYVPGFSESNSLLVRPYLLFPLVAWSALRFGAPGAVASLFLVGTCLQLGALYRTIPGVLGRTPAEAVLVHEAVFIALGFIGFVVAAALRETREALRVRDTFLSIASHELRTPVTALAIQTQLRAKRVAENDFRQFTPERLPALVAGDDRQVKRITRLLDDMFDISRLNTGTFALERAPADLRTLVRDAVASAAPLFRASGSELTLEGGDGAPIPGDFDVHRLEQAIGNLLANAAKYGRGRPVRVSVEARNSLGLVSVSDQGIGIAEKDLDRIFRPYERAVSANEVSGLGLGLHISNRIVQAHGGRLGVESEVGGGSKFWIELKLAP